MSGPAGGRPGQGEGKRGGYMKKGLRPLALIAMLAIIGAACSKHTGGPTTGVTTNGGPETGTTTGGRTTGTTTGGGEPVKVGLVYDTTGRGDKSFNDSAAAGLDKPKGQFNIESKELALNGGGPN